MKPMFYRSYRLENHRILAVSNHAVGTARMDSMTKLPGEPSALTCGVPKYGGVLAATVAAWLSVYVPAPPVHAHCRDRLPSLPQA